MAIQFPKRGKAKIFTLIEWIYYFFVMRQTNFLILIFDSFLTLHISRVTIQRMFLERSTKGVLFEKIAPFAGKSRKNSLLLIRLFACI